MGAAAAQPSPRTALVADDSVACRKLVAARLRADGYLVVEATDGQEALEQLEHVAPDVLIVDDVLPGLSGGELVQALNAHAGSLGGLRIALLVEYDSGLRRAALAGIPPSAVIRKPFDLDELAARLDAIEPLG